MLIVLDNFEGVTSATPLVSKLFLGCPHAHFLVTSQAPPNLDGDQIYQAPGMGIPACVADANSFAGHDAFELFRERARPRVHNWDLRSLAEITAVAEILRLVEGIPLAIELAAAWVGSRTLPEIRIGLGNRLGAEPAIYCFGPIVRSHRRHFLQQSTYSICVSFELPKEASSSWRFASHEEVFAQNDQHQDLLWQFVIPSAERIKVLRHLTDYNLNALSLFGTEESLPETLTIKVIDFRS